MRKEVKKWVAGFMTWQGGETEIITVQATFIDAPKTYILKKEDAASYREFSRLAAGYTKFDKKDPTLMRFISDTEEDAISKLHGRLAKDVVHAQSILRNREHLLQVTQEAIQEKKWRRVQ